MPLILSYSCINTTRHFSCLIFDRTDLPVEDRMGPMVVEANNFIAKNREKGIGFVGVSWHYDYYDLQTDDDLERFKKAMVGFINQNLQKANSFSVTFENGNELMISPMEGNYFNIGQLKHYTVAYGEKDDTYRKDGFMVSGSEYFAIDKPDEAISVFIKRFLSGTPHVPICCYSLEQIAATSKGSLSIQLHPDFFGKKVSFDYTNWRGERRTRTVKMLEFMFGSTEHHPEPQMLLRALDIDKNEVRYFAVRNIHSMHY
jgi:hypothetical protein